MRPQALVAWAAVLLTAAAPKEDVRTRFVITKFAGDEHVRATEDKIGYTLGKAGVVFRITRKGGIGSAMINLRQGRWPERLSVRFIGFGNLTSFSADNGKVALRGGVSVEEKKYVCLYDQDGNQIEDRARAAYTMTLERKKGSGRIEVVLPAKFCSTGTRELRLGWIDAFRR
ncbi:MAG TPA: hypothetical protein VG013_00075 [Gemmataceae bacterium]|jgi:hypothetical protein|nr:hypothetical protein [Gemmataceae bacterium]